MNQVFFVLVSCMASLCFVQCGGGGKGEETVYFKAQYPHHTIHKHHTEKIPDVKIIKVPVVQEVKVPEPYKVPYKVKVPFLVHQKIHTVVKEHHSHPVHTSEHVHHKPTHHHGKSHSFDEASHSFSSHAASDLTPMYVSHTPVSHAPVSHQSSHDAPASYKGFHHHQGFHPTEDAFPSYSHDFHSKLHTSVPSNIGFGSHEGKSLTYEVSESPEGPALFNSRSAKALSPGKMTEAFGKREAYPYPLAQDEGKEAEYLFGFDPMASSYDFTDL